MLLSRRLNRSLAPPDRVSLNVTLRCNLTCSMCTTCYDSPELSLDEIKGIIDQTADWGVEVFNPLGGEPFMRGDIEEILAYAVRRGFYVTVTTNGTLITKARARAIAAIPSDRLHFNISLDGEEQSNDEIRSTGMWKRAIQGYSRIREADEAAGNSRRKILANTILHARNADRFLSILDEQESLGFDGVQILNLFRQGDSIPPEASALWFHEDKLPKLEVLAEQLAGRAAMQGVVGYRIQNSPDSLRRIPSYYREALTPLEAPCWAGWKELYINADGQAIMCDGDLDFIRGDFGNVRSQTLQQLWASPTLQQRRSVVRTCKTPCVQDCYLRESSDSAPALVADAGRLIAKRAFSHLMSMRPTASSHPEQTLRMELSDVCPCSDPACSTPPSRWSNLIADIDDFQSDQWSRYRDEGRIDFGRGFMGFEVVRAIVNDLKTRRIRFGKLAIAWRGEPLLHPEAHPILLHLLDAIRDGHVADRLVIETNGQFLDERIAELSGHPAPQLWILNADKAPEMTINAAERMLFQHRHSDVAIWRAHTAHSRLNPTEVHVNGTPVFAGEAPPMADAIWMRRETHDHYLADQAATRRLKEVARAMGVKAKIDGDNRPVADAATVRDPIISWDGKVTMNRSDINLSAVEGDVVHSTFSAAWNR
jgi:MoaA/NifB/PqqE/SkfB family radical SAM enzyme